MSSTSPDRAPRPLPELDSPSPAGLARIAEALATHRAIWERIAVRERGGAFSTRLAMGTGWEAWLQGWPPGHRSDLHDHRLTALAVTVVRGELEELTLLTPGSASGPTGLGRRRLVPGELLAFGADHVHELSNPGPGHAVSVHVVGPQAPADDAAQATDLSGLSRS